MTTIKNQRVYVSIAEKIIERLKKKQCVIGDRLEPERELSAELGVGRNVIREAMVYLELSGMVEIRKGAGAFIKSLERIPFDSRFGAVTPFNILEARFAIEPYLSELAAANVNQELIKKLDNCIKMMEASCLYSDPNVRGRASDDADRQFHAAIAEASGNPLLINIHKDIMALHMKGDMYDRLNELTGRPSEDGYWNPDHLLIYEAIKSGDKQKAKEYAAQHLMNVIDLLNSGDAILPPEKENSR